MSARDELATVIETAYDLNEGMVTFELLAHAVLAAGYSKPRTITDGDEVAALPVGAVIRTVGGVPLDKWAGDDGAEWHVSNYRPWTDAEVTANLPATVLYTPKES